MLRSLAKKKKGFTMIELMVVVLILGLLTAIGIPSYRGAKIYAERRIIETNLRMIDSAIDLYFETGNTDDLEVDAARKPKSQLIPDYLHAPISGPGPVIYNIDQFPMPPNDRLEFHAFAYWSGDVYVGGHHYSRGFRFTIDDLPWKNENK